MSDTPFHISPLPGLMLQPADTMPVITELWVFVAIDPADRNEGVVAFYSHYMHSWIPLIAADTVRLEQMRKLAQEMQDLEPNKPIKLIKFSNREVIEELKPNAV